MAAGIILLIGVGFFFLDDFQEMFRPLFEWIEDMGAWGRFWFVFVYIILVILMVPTVLLTLAGGFLFGVLEGSVYVIAALVIGNVSAFSIARWLLSERVAEKIRHHPRLEGFNQGIGEEGWKIVMLVRLIPFFPAKISNYFFGLTPIKLHSFAIGNFIGLAPWTVTNVYVGSLAASLTRLGEHERSTWEWVLYGLGLLAAAGLAFFITRIAQRSIDRAVDGEGKDATAEAG